MYKVNLKMGYEKGFYMAKTEEEMTRAMVLLARMECDDGIEVSLEWVPEEEKGLKTEIIGWQQARQNN